MCASDGQEEDGDGGEDADETGGNPEQTEIVQVHVVTETFLLGLNCERLRCTGPACEPGGTRSRLAARISFYQVVPRPRRRAGPATAPLMLAL